MKPPVQIVEFIGLPGSGKSTVVRAWLHACSPKGVRVVDLGKLIASMQRGHLRKIWLSGASILRSPHLAWNVGKIWFGAGPSRPAIKYPIAWLRLHFLLTSGELKSRIEHYDLAVADQLLVQGLVSMATPWEREVGNRALKQTVRILTRLDLNLVAVDCAMDLAIRRMQTRCGGTSRYERGEAPVEAVEEYVRGLDKVSLECVTAGIRLFRLKADDPVSMKIGALEQHFRQHVQR